jgi:hypothetical protein
VANQVQSYFVTKFTDNVEFLVQQEDSRFWNQGVQRSFTGSGAVPTEQVGATSMTLVTGRNQPVVNTDTPANRRWIYPSKYFVADLVDTFEELEMSIDLTGKLPMAFSFAMNRTKDQTFLGAFFGTSQTDNVSSTGNAPKTAVAFPTSQQIAVTINGTPGNVTAVHLNVPKLRAARVLLKQAEVDLGREQAWVGMGALQEDDLLNQAQAISMDFQSKPILENGDITRFLGFNFIHSELLPVDSSGYRRLPVWVKSGMCNGNWLDNKTEIYQQPGIVGRPWQVVSTLMVGSTRLQEPKCVEIKCSEA